jgi:hypothetical protein
MTVFLAVLPSLILMCSVGLFFVLYRWAKKRKAAALGLGMMMHILMPVPNVEQSIIQVVEKKQVKPKAAKQVEEKKPD